MKLPKLVCFNKNNFYWAKIPIFTQRELLTGPLYSLETIQCYFKLTGKNALNLKFKTRFSQIGLSLGETSRRQKLRILAELLWCFLFRKNQTQSFTPKMGHFGFS